MTTHEQVWQLAHQGNAEAQCDLGLMYLDGIGVPRDPFTAVQWFRRAAEQGNALTAAANSAGLI